MSSRPTAALQKPNRNHWNPPAVGDENVIRLLCGLQPVRDESSIQTGGVWPVVRGGDGSQCRCRILPAALRHGRLDHRRMAPTAHPWRFQIPAPFDRRFSVTTSSPDNSTSSFPSLNRTTRTPSGKTAFRVERDFSHGLGGGVRTFRMLFACNVISCSGGTTNYWAPEARLPPFPPFLPFWPLAGLA
jgi:hypothetical protein